jgi:hypothetical protein
LTSKQQVFVRTYVTNGQNQTEAVLAAYVCKSRESARCMAHAVMQIRSVVLCLMVWMNDSPEEALLNTMLKKLQSGKVTPEYLQTLILYSKMRGLIQSAHVAANGSGADPLPPKQEARVIDGKKVVVLEPLPNKANLKDFPDI